MVDDGRPLHFDAVIVGAGISGIDAAYRLRRRNPNLTYAILERRATLGGTWDLFRFPGIRSDSDIATLGFPFAPYQGDRSIVDGATIRGYVADTARRYGIDRNIRYGHRVVSARWSSEDARWTLTCDVAGERVTLTCGFLLGCAGYYDYERPHAPDWPGVSSFGGRIVHPQFWPDGLDLAGKRVVVIGSGATAVTLVPALGERAAHVTMLQRSPSYIASLPSRDPLANALRARLPRALADVLVRWKNIAYSTYVYRLARRRPAQFRALLRGGVLQAFGSAYDARVTTSTCTSIRRTSRGISGCVWFPIAISSRRSARVARRWSRVASRRSPRRGFGSSRATCCRQTSW